MTITQVALVCRRYACLPKRASWRGTESKDPDATEPQVALQVSRAERGLSLVEIMVVLVIIGLVTSMVGIAVYDAYRDAQVRTAQIQIGKLADALDLYRLHNRKLPSTADGLMALTQPTKNRRPIMPELPVDPWGNDYAYVYPGDRDPRGFDLWSYGPDAVEGGGDDVTSWNAEP